MTRGAQSAGKSSRSGSRIGRDQEAAGGSEAGHSGSGESDPRSENSTGERLSWCMVAWQREKAAIPPQHTFAPLPGFFKREAEVKALERSLEGVPSFTVLFGASSVGKTALLREVLSDDRFHVRPSSR